MTKAKVKHLWLGDRIEYEGPLTFGRLPQLKAAVRCFHIKMVS